MYQIHLIHFSVHRFVNVAPLHLPYRSISIYQPSFTSRPISFHIIWVNICVRVNKILRMVYRSMTVPQTREVIITSPLVHQYNRAQAIFSMIAASNVTALQLGINCRYLWHYYCKIQLHRTIISFLMFFLSNKSDLSTWISCPDPHSCVWFFCILAVKMFCQYLYHCMAVFIKFQFFW